MNSLVYIHGFNSSAKGIKAKQSKDLMLQLGLVSSFRAPNLFVKPLDAIKQLEEIIPTLDKPTLIGSSLGGYYATYLAEKHHLKALLINPVVLPHKLLGKAYREQANLQAEQRLALDEVGKILQATYICDERFVEKYIDDLASLEIPKPTDRERFKVWLKTGDEILDYRFAEEWYKDCDVTIDEGGDHSFADYGERLPEILEWAGITKTN